jgi:hypothetical protein
VSLRVPLDKGFMKILWPNVTWNTLVVFKDPHRVSLNLGQGSVG